MIFKPKSRFKIAIKWFPIEFLAVIVSLLCGWLINQTVFKPTYTASSDIVIQRDIGKNKSKQQRNAARKLDSENVTQFNVVPRKRWVLNTASEYAYTHYGTLQSLTDLSESVSATAIPKQPKLRLSVTSSSKAVARQNLTAFSYAVKTAIDTVDDYQVKIGKVEVNYQLTGSKKNVYKYALIVGIFLAVITPYLVMMIRGEEDGDKDAS